MANVIRTVRAKISLLELEYFTVFVSVLFWYGFNDKNRLVCGNIIPSNFIICAIAIFCYLLETDVKLVKELRLIRTTVSGQGFWLVLLPHCLLETLLNLANVIRLGPVLDFVVLTEIAIIFQWVIWNQKWFSEIWNRPHCQIIIYFICVSVTNVVFGSPFWGLYFAICCHLNVILSKSTSTTLGEAGAISQLVSLGLFTINFNSNFAEIGMFALHCDILTLMQLAFLGCFVLIAVTLVVPASRHSSVCYLLLGLVAISFGFLPNDNLLLYVANYVQESPLRVWLMVYWLGATGISIVAAVVLSQSTHANSIFSRKLFHGLIILIMVPPILMGESELLCLATCFASVSFILLEACRVLNVYPIGHYLNAHLRQFLDYQDKGLLIVTPVYLIVGLSLPVWIHQYMKDINLIASLSGVFSLGIGDACAAIGGHYFGKTRWPGTKKTLEGTLSAIVSQIVALFVLIPLGFNLVSAKALIAIVLTSVLEGVTCQIDNLVLPLFMFVFLAH